MDKVMKVLKNKWFILFVSILNGVYTAGLLYFAYMAVFYTIEFENTLKFAVIYSIISVIVGLLMYYTRRSALTAVFNILNLVAFLPSLLLNWGNWPLLIPAAIVTLFGFFSCKMNDAVKTVFGTIFLLVYIIGCIIFFLVMNVFMVKTTDTVLESGISPSGNFRYYVVNMENKSSGKTAAYIEPNNLDIDVMGMFKLNTTMKKLVKQANNPTTMELSWDGEILYINNEEYFDEKDFSSSENGAVTYNFEDDNWTHTYFEAEYPIFDSINTIVNAAKKFIAKLKGDEAILM